MPQTFVMLLLSLRILVKGSTEPRPPGPIVKSSLKRFHAICRWATGELTQTEASAKDLSDEAFVEAAKWPAVTNNNTQSTIAATDSGAPVQKVKLSVLDAHNLSGEVPILDEDSVLACYERYHIAVRGIVGGLPRLVPKQGCEPSLEQLTALQAQLKLGIAWVDFSTFAPFGQRAARDQLWTALQLRPDGQLHKTSQRPPVVRCMDAVL